LVGISAVGCVSNSERYFEKLLKEEPTPLIEKELQRTLAYIYPKDKKTEAKKATSQPLTLDYTLKIYEPPRDLYRFDFRLKNERKLTKSEAKREGVLVLTGIVEEKVRNIPVVAELTGWLFDTGYFVYDGVRELERLDGNGFNVKNTFHTEGIQRLGLSSKIIFPWKTEDFEGDFYILGSAGTNIDIMDENKEVETFKGFSSNKNNQTGWEAGIGITIYICKPKRDINYGAKKH